ncbi:MAG: hypothetical protein RLZZ490_2309, partial [Cyanobacteriota bacterium]
MKCVRPTSIQKFIAVLLISLMVVTMAPTVSAQLPFFSGGNQTETTVTGKGTPWWDINKARRCGRLWCSDIYLRGSFWETLIIGYSPGLEESPQAAAAAVEFRAQQVESIFNAVYFQLIALDQQRKINNGQSKKLNINFFWSQAFKSRNLSFPDEAIPDVIPNLDLIPSPSPQNTAAPNGSSSPGPSPEPRLRPTQAFPRSELADPRRKNLDIHPLTPTVAVGIKNNQTVIFIPPQPELGLAPQTIITVNEADEIANGKPVEILAYEWRDQIRESFDGALWGHELDQQYPWMRYQISALSIIVLAMPVAILVFMRSILRRRDRQLRQQLKLLTRSLTKETEAEAIDPEITKIGSEVNTPELTDHTTLPPRSPQFPKPPPFPWLLRVFRRIPGAHRLSLVKNTAIDSVNDAWQNIGDFASLSLKRQSLIKQQCNVINLIAWILLWLQVSCFFLAVAILVYIFPSIRPYTLLFIGQAMYFPLLWIGVTLLDKIA